MLGKFLLLTMLFTCFSYSQVGIGTTSPKSSLDITISNPTNPSNTDGLLIPRIDIFPTVNPLVDQQGMLIYLTTIDGSSLPGFYYWNNLTTSWINLGADNLGNHIATTNIKLNGNWLSNDGDSEGVYVAGNGNVGINVSNPNQKLEVNSDQNESAILGRVRIGYMGYNDWAGFSHIDRASAGNYALLQNTNGLTILNASTGQDILFRNNNSTKAILDQNGRFGINTTNPTEELHVAGNIRMVDGNEQVGYILMSDANGTASWAAPSSLSSGVFGVSSNTVSVNIGLVDEAIDDFVFGSSQLNDDTDTNHDNRFFFDKSKAAFRVGQVTGADWDDLNRGLYSFASGYNTEASGSYSSAFGRLGNATGNYSTVMGNLCTSSGDYAMAWGSVSEAVGKLSTAWGSNSDADGDYSTAGGYNVKANSGYETAIGRYNTDNTPNSATGWNTSDKIFVIGNGTGNASSSRSNAFIVFKNGNATLAGTLTQSSDRTLKKNINPLNNSLSNILNLNGYTYNWKKTDNRDKGLQIGVIAQEVEALYPELVRKDSKGKLTVNYTGLVPVLIEATKEQQKELDNMKIKMKLMMQEINKLKENTK